MGGAVCGLVGWRVGRFSGLRIDRIGGSPVDRVFVGRLGWLFVVLVVVGRQAGWWGGGLFIATPCAACSCSLSFATCASWASSSYDFSASRPSAVARSASSSPQDFPAGKGKQNITVYLTSLPLVSVQCHGQVNSVKGHITFRQADHMPTRTALPTVKPTTYRPLYRTHTDHVTDHLMHVSE